MTYLLYDEPPLCISPTLATRIGLNEAILLQQVHYWLKIAEQGKQARNFRGGQWWVYNTLADWHIQFPFWSLMTLRRTLESLEAKGIVDSASLSEDRRNRTKWYTVNYRRLEEIANTEAESEQIETSVKPVSGRNRRSKCSNSSHAFVQVEQIGSVQNEQMQQPKMSSCIGTERTTENTQKKTLNVEEGINFVAAQEQSIEKASKQPNKPSNSHSGSLRSTVLDNLTAALVNELGDLGSEKRHRQLLDICERNGLDDLSKQALLATRRRLAQEQAQGVLEKPGAYYQKILIGLLEDHQVFVPPAGSKDEQAEVKRLARASLQQGAAPSS